MDRKQTNAAVASVKCPVIPRPSDLPLRARVPVYLTHYERPSKLFLRYLSDSNECVDQCDCHIEPDRHHVYEVFLGMCCMVCPDSCSRQALRAVVTDVRRNLGGIQVLADVLYVDEGRTDVVGLDCVYPISEDEALKPYQAVACCIRRIRPTLVSSCYDLQRLIDDSVPFYYEAIFYGCSDRGIYEIDLFINCPETPTGPKQLNVAELLVCNGYAEFLGYLTDAPLGAVKLESDTSCHLQPESEGASEHSQPESRVTDAEAPDSSPSTLSACTDSLSDTSSHCSELPAAVVPKENAIDIKVTFILTPDHWYGQPTSTVKELLQMRSIIESCEEGLCAKRDIKKGSYLIYRDLPRETGTRVRVEEVSGGKCRIFLIDYGNRKTVKSSCLFRMDPRLRTIAPLALRFQLVDIQPWAQWTEAAVLRFEELTRTDSSLTAVIVETRSTGDEFNDTIYLAKLLSETYGDVAECMSREGYARMPTAKRKKQTVAQNANAAELPVFNPMQEDYNNPLNSYSVNTDDVGVAASNFVAQTERICKFFSSQGYCRQGALCVFRHIAAEANSAILHVTEPVNECVRHLKPPEPGSLLLGQISTFGSPIHFYLIFPYGRKSVDRLILEGSNSNSEETLESLMEDMQGFCNRGHFMENRLFIKSVGEFVAARCSEDNCWYRAQVVSIGDGNRLKVLYVDFGFSEWVPLNEVRALDPRFTHLPIQSQQSALADDELLCFLADDWDLETCKSFLQCVAGETLLVETVCYKEGLLHVKLYFYRDDAIFSVTDFMKDLQTHPSQEKYYTRSVFTRTNAHCT